MKLRFKPALAAALLTAWAFAATAATVDFGAASPDLVKVPPSSTIVNLYEFDLTHGSAPESAVLPVLHRARHAVMGVTYEGGAHGTGALYRLYSNGEMDVLHSFVQNGQDGFLPSAPLTLMPDGSVWGTTFGGGHHYSGTIFRVSRAGAYSVVHSFGDVPGDGSIAMSALAAGPDGNLYGTTISGGQSGQGTIFRISPAGAYTVLYSFTGLDGSVPQHGLVLGDDGAFYGGTNTGGEYGNGTLFRITLEGRFTRLLSLSNFTTGVYPSQLVRGHDGMLYGAMAGSSGVLFRLSLDGRFTVLHAFGEDASEGYSPTGLTLASDGNFYGTNAGVASDRAGTLFRMTPSGSVTVLHTFAPGSAQAPMDGAYPLAPPVEVKRGVLVGTTRDGGSSPPYGTIYSYTIPARQAP